MDARWTNKLGKNHLGYKNHVRVNVKTKIIDNISVTAANVHDSQVILELVEEADKGFTFYADTPCDSKDIRNGLRKKKADTRLRKRGSRHVKLTVHQKGATKCNVRTWCRVEDDFISLRNRASNTASIVVSLARYTAVFTLDILINNIGQSPYLERIQ